MRLPIPLHLSMMAPFIAINNRLPKRRLIIKLADVYTPPQPPDTN